MTRALVLGGGGPVGVGWEAGLLVGLAESGVETASAEAVIGTSAGSIVGFTLASGGDLRQAVGLVDAANQAVAGSGEGAAAGGLEQLLATVAEAAADPGSAEAVRARLGRLAAEAETISETDWLGMFDFFAGAEWPGSFACTAVDAADGRLRVWDRAAGVEVRAAVASSCAVPMIFPTVAIDGRRWMDGGVRDMLNADLAAGHSTVLAVSCTLLELPEGLSTPEMDAVFGATLAHLDRLRSEGAKVETVIPSAEMLELSGYGLNLMDFTLTAAAYEAGLRQGAAEAERLSAFWAG